MQAPTWALAVPEPLTVLCLGPTRRYGGLRKLGVPYFGVLIVRILLFGVLY